MPRVALAIATLVLAVTQACAGTISYTDLLARLRPQPTMIVSYGPAKDETGALFLPAGKGAHPVVVLIHGGCWLAELPGTELMDYIAADLQARGYAVWNIEYRRIGGAGGGYPGTFLDIADGIDALRKLAPGNALDLNHVVVVGHSAGGHLALWAAARAHLPKTSPLYRGNPLPIAGVVSLGGIADLEAYRAEGPSACGGPSTIDGLTGAVSTTHADIYADTSPARLLPLGTRYTIVSGDLDPIVPKRFGEAFTAKAHAAHEHPREIEIAGAGHFELIDPKSGAWKQIVAEIDALAN